MHQPRIITTLFLSLALSSATACTELETIPEDQLRDSDSAGDTDDPDPRPSVAAYELIGKHIHDVLQLAPYYKTYEMLPNPADSQYTALFNLPEVQDPMAGWPAHGLQWKDAASNFAHSFDIAAAHTEITSYPFFGWYIATGDHNRLNAIEAEPAVFSSDPNGTWMENNITDPTVGIVYAALVMHFWRSPVYVDATYNYPAGSYGHGSFSHVIALQKLKFSIPTAPDLLAACGLPSNATPATALSTVPQCNHGAILIGDEVSLWNDFLCPGCPNNYVPYDPQVSLDPADLANAWWGSLGNQGQMVFDPPGTATSEDLQGIAVLAEALADQVLIADEDGYLMLLRDYVEQLEG